MAERGPLPRANVRRRNARPATNRRVLVGRPALPKGMSGEARAEWRRIVPEIEGMGMLARVDRALLIRYCTAWADWCELNQTLQTSGKLVMGVHRQPVRNPVWLMRNEAEQVLTDLGRQLGLTPVARIRAGVVHEVAVVDDSAERGPTALDDYRTRLGASR